MLSTSLWKQVVKVKRRQYDLHALFETSEVEEFIEEMETSKASITEPNALRSGHAPPLLASIILCAI